VTKPDHPENIIYMNEREIDKAIEKMCQEIITKKKNLNQLAVVGIKTKGEFIAKRLINKIEQTIDHPINKGTLDITLYRDDFDTLGNLSVGETDLLFNVEGKRIILVDDVLYTGRTIRSAIDQIVDFGRPAEIELAVLVDRGGRELPICGNYVGEKILINHDEYIQVQIKEIEGIDQVIRLRKEKSES